MSNSNSLGINSARLRADFDALAQFGATGDGGVHRPTFNDAHLAAREWFREQIEKAGLVFRTDGAGNHSAFLACQPETSNVKPPTLMLGSHLDSVPHGGRFDGALGVLCALEVLRVVKENHLALAMDLEAMDFTDEEGTLVGFIGSRAIAGTLRAEHLQNPRTSRANFETSLARAGLTEPGMLTASRPLESFGGYLELHIEQSGRLYKSQTNIGIASAIVGMSSYCLKFIGRADHAGSTPMADRLDPTQGASAFALAVRELTMRDFPGCVANVGKMEFAPGAFNIVPAHIFVALEFRAPTVNELQKLDGALIARAHAEAQRWGLGLEIEFISTHAATPMSDRAQRAFANACNALNLTHMPLVSGATHDGMHFANLCPVGMIFVPSVDGASHAPRELTEWQDCVNGANVLLRAAIEIAS